jgi:hypothetical protein
MAFGGYKFKGYKVVRANLATNTYANWCLLVHQARIKAFMESCALSGAQWHFSKTNGPLSFEDYGNVIYRVANANGDYHDYLSFFKYGDEELYYMIATLGEYYTNATSGSAPTFDESALFGTYAGTQSQVKEGGVCSCLALDSDFSDLGPFTTMPAKSLACSSVVDENVTTASNAYSNESTANGNGLSLGTIRIGFATKGKDIVNVYQKNITSVESGDAFSGYSTPNDTYGLLKYIFAIFKSDETTASSESARYYLNNYFAECLTDQGSSSFYKSKTVQSIGNAVLQIDIPTQAFYDSNNTIIPFGSATLTTGNGNGKAISSVGMLTKGVIKGELLSVNYTRLQSSQPAVGSVVMGGNLVTAIRCTPKTSSPYGGYLIPGAPWSSSISSSNTACPAAYVGWDPSNPNINDESSWPELSLQ